MFSRSVPKRMARRSALAVAAFVMWWPVAGLAETASVPALATALPKGVIAIVNGIPIPETRLDAAVQEARQPDTPELRQHLKQQLIVRELFRQKTDEGRYQDRPEVLEVVRLARQTAATQLYLKDNIRAEPVTDAQVRSRYDEMVGERQFDAKRPAQVPEYDEASSAIRRQLQARALQEATSRFSDALVESASIQQ
jgi:peptidyl-prolyl cis-trans isomerase C